MYRWIAARTPLLSRGIVRKIRSMKRPFLFVVLVLILLWLRSAFVAVDVAEYAYITRFGQPIVTIDGGTNAGLHMKWPWPIDAVQSVDRRLQSFDLPAVESLTRDAAAKTIDKTLAVDAFVTWTIPDATAADKFIRTVGTTEQAKRILAPRFSGRLAAIMSTMPLDDLIAVAELAKIDERSAKLRTNLLGDDLADKVRADYGIQVLDVRVRRLSYPEAVRTSISERIRSERQRKVADYESDGRKRASDIASAAEKDARTIEAEARAKKATIEGQADVEADRIRNEAHAQDPEFYQFLQKLKAYQSILNDTRDVLLLSTRHPLFDYLLSPKAEPKK
jgi:modulator of FtsH protease HflC